MTCSVVIIPNCRVLLILAVRDIHNLLRFKDKFNKAFHSPRGNILFVFPLLVCLPYFPSFLEDKKNSEGKYFFLMFFFLLHFLRVRISDCAVYFFFISKISFLSHVTEIELVLGGWVSEP